MQRWVTLLCAVAMTLALVACSKSNKNNSAASANTGSHAVTTTSASTASGSTGSGSTAISASGVAQSSGGLTPVEKLVQDVRPSIVRVDVSATVSQRGPFGLGGIPGIGGVGGQQAQEQGTGTGMVLDTQGHILTNDHVVTLESQNVAPSIKVDLANGKSVDAKVIGQDQQTDLAVLQVSASDVAGVKPIQWADPSSIIVGEQVVAIGYALDLGGAPTVTTGVVSATDRIIDESNGVTISGAVQTDASVNPGNSGGPLLDLSEHVIGVNTAGLTGTAQQPATGINFAISVTTAKPVANDLIQNGHVTRGYMGVGVVNITPELAQANNLPVSQGAGIEQVASGSPAQQAGLQQGDIITKVGSVTINNTGDLTNALTQYGPGTKVTITYYRGQSQKTTQITLGQRPPGS